MRKIALTTKRTKDTKGSDTFDLKLRELRDLRGKFFFSSWLWLRRPGTFVVKSVSLSLLAASPR